MKVLIINEECGTGSTGRICTDLALTLEENGDTARIAFGRNASIVPKQFQKYAVRIGNDFDLIKHGLVSRIFDATGFGSKNATKKFINWMVKFNPDIIHLHNLHGYYINIDLLFRYLKEANKPVVWTLHDVWAFTGHSAYCDAVKCEKWKIGCKKCPQKLVYPRAYIDRSEYNWKRKKEIFSGINRLTIVTPSIWLSRLVEKSFLNKYPVKVIHNGIDTTKFKKVYKSSKKDFGLEGKFVLLSVATIWNDLKGLQDFMQLAKLLDYNFRIILVGGMTEDQKRSLPSNIIHIQRTNDIEEMVNLYNMADAYINLSHCDTYPTVNLESLACGTPVITYEVGGSPESVKKYGGAVVKKDIKEVLKALKTIKNIKVDISNLNELDRRFAIQSYLDLYRGVV